MGGAGEHIHGGGPLGFVAELPEDLHVPAQRCRVAGDIDHLLRPHGCHGGDDLRGQALPGRIHRHYIRAQAVALQLGSDVRRIAAEKLRVFDVIAEGVLLGVPDGGGHDLRADDPFGCLCETQGNGTDTAVEVQYRFIPGKAREFQRLAVQHLRLIPVYELLNKKNVQ